jgi:tetratricopeptide (TPR) repeat protein
MANFFPLQRWMLFCAIVALMLSACKKSAPPNSQAAALLLTDLLGRADSSTLETILPAIRELPGTYRDSFFLKRIANLNVPNQLDEIQQTIGVYQKWCPGQQADCKSHFYQAVRLQYAGKFDSAQVKYAQAAAVCAQIGDKLFLANILDAYSGNLSTQGRYDEAFAMKYRAISLYDTLGQTRKAMEVRSYLANMLISRGEFDRAITLLEKDIATAELLKDSINLAYMWAAKGTAYGQQKDFANALLFHQKALAIRNLSQYASQKGESLYHIGRILGKMGQLQASLDTLRVAERVVEGSSDKQGIGFIQSGIGESLYKLNRYEEAYPYLEKSLKTGLDRKQYPAAVAAARMLSESHKLQQHFKEALSYQEIFLALKDSMFNQEKIKISQELIHKYEANEKALKIVALELENTLAAQRNWWISGLSLLLFAIFFYTFRLKAAREKYRQESENIRAEAQALRLQQALEVQKIKLAANQSSLEDYARMLIDRNEQISALMQQMELDSEQKKGSSTRGNMTLYERVILTESDWDNFQHHFNEVYPGYISDLRTKYPDLSPAEIRLVVLDKIGLSLKETSAILGNSIEAVKKGRYRLKKKYNLEGEDLTKIL